MIAVCAYSVLVVHLVPASAIENTNPRSRVRPVIFAISFSDMKALHNWSIKCDWPTKATSRAENHDF